MVLVDIRFPHAKEFFRKLSAIWENLKRQFLNRLYINKTSFLISGMISMFMVCWDIARIVNKWSLWGQAGRHAWKYHRAR